MLLVPIALSLPKSVFDCSDSEFRLQINRRCFLCSLTSCSFVTALIFVLPIALVTNHRFYLLPKYEYVTLVPINPLKLCYPLKYDCSCYPLPMCYPSLMAIRYPISCSIVPKARMFLLTIALVTDHRFFLLPKYEYVTLVPINPLQLCYPLQPK